MSDNNQIEGAEGPWLQDPHQTGVLIILENKLFIFLMIPRLCEKYLKNGLFYILLLIFYFCRPSQNSGSGAPSI